MNGGKDTQQMQQPLRKKWERRKVLHSYLVPEGINRQLRHTLKSGASVLSHSIAQLSCDSLASSSLFFSLRQPLKNLFGFLFSLVPVAYRKGFGLCSESSDVREKGLLLSKQWLISMGFHLTPTRSPSVLFFSRLLVKFHHIGPASASLLMD